MAATVSMSVSLAPKTSFNSKAARKAKFGNALPPVFQSASLKKTETTAGRRNLVVNASGAVSLTGERKALYPKVVCGSLPKLYVYDHCPFCVRVRMALGVKNIKHEVVFMGNDDVKTPTDLIGKKIAPIIELPNGVIMGESMDIIEYFDKDSSYGPANAIAPKTGRKDISAWQKSVKDLLRLLHRPRYMMAALPEFQQQDSRDYFVYGHPVPPYDKPEWKAESFPQAKRWECFQAAYGQSAQLVPQINAALRDLDDMIASPYGVNASGGVSMDDIDLWARLRSVTLVDGVEMPPKMLAYMEYFAEVGDCPLYFGMKC